MSVECGPQCEFASVGVMRGEMKFEHHPAIQHHDCEHFSDWTITSALTGEVLHKAPGRPKREKPQAGGFREDIAFYLIAGLLGGALFGMILITQGFGLWGTW